MSTKLVTTRSNFRRRNISKEQAIINVEEDLSGSELSDCSSCSSCSIIHDNEKKCAGVCSSTIEKHENENLSSSEMFKRFAKKYEISRKMFHSFTGFFTIWLYINGINQKQLVFPLSIMAFTCFLQDFIRFRSPTFNAKFKKYYGFMMRESELNQYNGILYFLIGVILTSSFLPKDLAIMCNFLLSWADTNASFYGRMFGKYTWKVGENKSLAGCMAAFATGIISCALLYAYLIPKYHQQVDKPGDIFYDASTSKLSFPIYMILCGFIAAFSESVYFFNLDDNFTIPVISGVCLHTLVTVFK